MRFRMIIIVAFLMRVISILISLLAIYNLLFPQIAIAEEKNTNIKTNKLIVQEKFKKIPYNYEGYVAIEQPLIVNERDDILLKRWKYKQETKWNNLPKESFIINASAYTAAADECGWNTGITASGLKVKKDRTIACPPEYPFGAKIKIDGYGTYTCEDRGGAIKGNHFDIYMETKSEAFAFGRRNLTAQVVN